MIRFKIFQYPACVFMAAALISKPCFAIYLESLSIEDGLSQGTAYTIIQDHHGFLWIGTGDGLNRYDGVQFIHFRDKGSNPNSKTSLTDGRVQDIVADSDGNFWISTRNGLNFLDINTYKTKHYLHDPQNPHSLANNTTHDKKFDSKGFLWITTSGGLSHIDPTTEKFKTFLDNRQIETKYKCSEVTRTLDIDSNDNIWVGSANSLCKLDTKTETYTLIDYRNDLEKSASTSIVDLIYNKNEGLWIAAVDGLFLYDIKTGKSKSFYHDPNDDTSLPHYWLSTLAEDASGDLWVGTTHGLGLLDKQTGKFTNFRYNANDKTGLSSNEIFSIFTDQSGLVWIGTNGAGLNIYNPRQQAFKHIKKSSKTGYSLSDSAVWEVLKAYGYIWIGTSNGLNRYDPKTGKIKHYQPDPNNSNSLVNANVVDIDAGNNRDLWIGTWNGISRFYIDSEQFENYSKQVDRPETYPLQTTLALFFDKKKNLLWLGSAGHGAAILNPATNEYTHLKHNPNDNNSLRGNYISHIYKAMDNTMWFGTRSGITHYFPDENNFEHLMNSSTEIGKECYGIKELDDRRMLFSSSNGLSVYDKINQKLLKHYSLQEGLDDDYIYSIEIDSQGYVWVSTNLGISRINLTTHEIKNFNILDGLQGYEFNGDASFNDGEYLYFGGFNGFNYFRPEDINTNNFVPPIAITDFSIHGKSLNQPLITQAMQLTYKDSFFAIEFAALDFTHPEKNQYAYMLEGFDQDWINNGNRNFASYTNLDGGEYTFRIKAANKYGIWNEQGITLPISITPPFWKTLWFRIIAALLIIIIIFTVYALRIRAIKARNEMLKQEVKARTAELEEQKLHLEDTLLELGETKDALIEAAHKAGMADTATGVLHNVGNILSSVNTSAGIIRETVAQSVNHKFLKANQLLVDNKDNIKDFIHNNPKTETLLHYYSELSDHFKSENARLEENALRLIEKISAIHDVINAQQRYAKGHDFIELLLLPEIIEDTLMLQSASIGRHEIKIIKEYDDDVPRVPAQKAKLVQILVNLYKNAKESMDANKTSKNILTIIICKDENYAYIKISDTGMGIEKNQLEQIFSHGFTTKSNGHGFGLHSCANHMTEMRGKMWAESEGLGKGATFIMQFPLETNDEHAEITVNSDTEVDACVN